MKGVYSHQHCIEKLDPGLYKAFPRVPIPFPPFPAFSPSKKPQQPSDFITRVFSLNSLNCDLVVELNTKTEENKQNFPLIFPAFFGHYFKKLCDRSMCVGCLNSSTLAWETQFWTL